MNLSIIKISFFSILLFIQMKCLSQNNIDTLIQVSSSTLANSVDSYYGPIVCANSNRIISLWCYSGVSSTFKINETDASNTCDYILDSYSQPQIEWYGGEIVNSYLTNQSPIGITYGCPSNNNCLSVANVKANQNSIVYCKVTQFTYFPPTRCKNGKYTKYITYYQTTVSAITTPKLNVYFVRNGVKFTSLNITNNQEIIVLSEGNIYRERSGCEFEVENLETNNIQYLSGTGLNTINEGLSALSFLANTNTKIRARYFSWIRGNSEKCTGEWSEPIFVNFIDPNNNQKPKTLHYHQFTNSTNRRLLDTTNVIKVCADGVNSSILKFSENDLNYSQYGIRIKQDPTSTNSKVYGSISVLNQNSDSLVVRYTHPVLVNSTSLFSEHDIEIINTTSPNSVVGTYKVQVYRPPVLMVHGLWSNNSSFEAMNEYLLNLGKFNENLLQSANYRFTSNASFNQNKTVVPANINSLINKVLLQKISTSKVVLIGHSMGGILGRLYLQSEEYKNNILKIITINTPHSGSQFGDLLNDDNYSERDVICGLMKRWPIMDFTCSEAVNDLKVTGSTILNSLNGTTLHRNDIPSHTITTTHNLNLFVLPTNLKVIHTNESIKDVLQFDLNQLFNNDLNDGIVSLQSQKGGLSGTCTSNFTNQLHIGAQSNISVLLKVNQLLDADPSGNNFCIGFNPPILQYSTPQNTLSVKGNRTTNINSISSAPSVSIITPKNDVSVNVGESISIRVEGQNLSYFKIFINYKQDSLLAAKINSLPFQVKIPITTQFKRGICNILVIGYDSNGNSVTSSSTFIVNDCQSSPITITSLDKDFYQSSEPINLSSKVPSNVNLILKSEKSISLTSGFTTDTPTLISASVEPCSTSAGLVCSYPFNGNANDASGNNFNGTVSGATLTTDRFGQSNKAMLFDGNDKITVPNFNQVTGNSPRSISLWVKTTQTNEHNYWIYWGAYSDNASCIVGNIFDSPPTNRFGLLGWANDTYITNSTHFDNNWHQVVVTHDGQITKLFIDGILKTQRTLTRPYQTGIDKLTIGCSIADHAFFKGSLDDIKIFDRCLTDDEVVQQYYLEKP